MNIDLRPARSTDAGALGHILYRFQEETEWMPKLYTAAEMIRFCGAMIDYGWVTVADGNGRIHGFIARDGEEICALYMAQQTNRKGVGRRLLGHAKARRSRLWLRTLQVNEGAQRFYRRQGFVESERGDGAENDENMPDIIFVWEKKEAAT
ncbi:GNAT family N-acetyltransferase [Seohaeicola saemankumensis]|nr:GNAT family N-acetyltransferase [Seohaeicola saemankumensis]MCA0873202.1 GNAT family N-acetyltransferase [Seohaeicola saemankumensis]